MDNTFGSFFVLKKHRKHIGSCFLKLFFKIFFENMNNTILEMVLSEKCYCYSSLIFSMSFGTNKFMNQA